MLSRIDIHANFAMARKAPPPECGNGGGGGTCAREGGLSMKESVTNHSRGRKKPASGEAENEQLSEEALPWLHFRRWRFCLRLIAADLRMTDIAAEIGRSPHENHFGQCEHEDERRCASR